MVEQGRWIGMLCSDIAKTLIHSGYDELNKDLIKLSAGRAVHRETVRLLEELRKQRLAITFVTGMRTTGYEEVRENVPHDYGITEHGGVIWLPDGSTNESWDEHLKKDVEAVKAYQRVVEEMFRGYNVLQSANRRTMFRLQADGGGRLSLDEILENLSRVRIDGSETTQQPLNHKGTTYLIPVPVGVVLFKHQPDPPEESIECIPEKSGKLNALSHRFNELGISWNKVAGFGDDDNDISFIAQSGIKMTFESASQGVIKVVNIGEALYTYITPLASHRGTIDVLEHMLAYAVPLMKARS